MSLENDELQKRFQLLCQASQPNTKIDIRLQSELLALSSLIDKDLVALTKQGCPDNITDILTAFEHELTRFRQFCEFPSLAKKSIVGLGGGFSAGKSSFINKLIGKKCLAVETDATTSMPAYVMQGENELIKAINIHDCAIDLTLDELKSLTHEEKALYGSQVGLLLKAAFVSLPEFKWQNLALLDTPGYSKPEDDSFSARTDENLARDQLNTSDYIIWLIPADNGTISEEDIKFLSSLNRDIPKLIVLSKADKKTPKDIDDIVNLVRTTLGNRGIAVVDVVPFSRKGKQYSLERIEAKFDEWNKQSKPLQFAQNFKRQFLAYESFIEQELREAHLSMDKLNKILVLLEDEHAKDAEILLRRVQKELNALKSLSESLKLLNQAFFHKLKLIGDMTTIPMPEPSALDLMDLKESNFASLLTEYCKNKDIKSEFDLFDDYQWTGASNAKVQKLCRYSNQDNPFAELTWQGVSEEKIKKLSRSTFALSIAKIVFAQNKKNKLLRSTSFEL